MRVKKYCLDTSAWIDLLSSETGLSHVIDACRSKRFEIGFSQENTNELLVNGNIRDETRKRDLPRLA